MIILQQSAVFVTLLVFHQDLELVTNATGTLLEIEKYTFLQIDKTKSQIPNLQKLLALVFGFV